MKLILKNFRCYTEKTFEIPDNGITLIHGPSGIGKSSICMAINFVLYGTGNKLITHDKTTCSVELILSNGMHIKRSKRPNYLNIDNGKYTDDSAQEVINQLFGYAFDITGYLEQGASNSFLLMSPANKSEFLERFAFRGIDIASMKEKVKVIIKSNETELLKTQGQLQLIKKLRDELTPIDKVLFPIKCKKEQQELAEKNEQVKLKNCSTLIRKELDTISTLESEKLNLSVILASVDTHQLKILEDELADSLSIITSITLSDFKGDDYIEYLETQLNYTSKIREYETLSASIQELNDSILRSTIEEDKIRLDTVNNLKSSIWSESTREDAQSELESYTELVKLLSEACYIHNRIPKDYKDKYSSFNEEEFLKKIKTIESEKIQEEKRLVLLKEQITILTCPSCEATLRHINGELVEEHNIIETDDLMNDIKNTESKVKRYENELIKLKQEYTVQINIQKIVQEYKNKVAEINEIYTIDTNQPIHEVKNDITSEITRLKQYIEENIKNQKTIDSLTSDIGKVYSYSIQRLKDTLANKKSMLDKIQIQVDINQVINEEELRNDLSKQKEIKQAQLQANFNYEKSLKKLTELRRKYENILNNRKKEDIQLRVDEIDNEIKIHKIEIQRLEEAKTKHNDNLEKIRKYKEYNSYMEKYTKFSSQIIDLETLEKKWVYALSGATKFKDLISEAESMAVAGVISSINSHARIYLDDFFPENPISVSLQTFKETKKATKPQINVEIDYKEMSCSVDTLSGGEVARVSLAYTLALAEMINSPIVILDESTSNLDHEMANIVIHSIKEHMVGKIIIMVAHQAETGAYDNVIKL